MAGKLFDGTRAMRWVAARGLWCEFLLGAFWLFYVAWCVWLDVRTGCGFNPHVVFDVPLLVAGMVHGHWWRGFHGVRIFAGFLTGPYLFRVRVYDGLFWF